MKSTWQNCKVVVWNVRSILGTDKLISFLHFIEDHSIDICCISETWFDSDRGRHTNILKDYGFEIEHSFRKDKRGGGTAIIFNKNLKINKHTMNCPEYKSFEYSFIFMPYQKQKLALLCVYRLQEISCLIFCAELEVLLQKLFDMCNILLVVGDFNIWAEIKTDSNVKKVNSVMKSYGLSQIVNQPTHDMGHTLDLVFLNEHQLHSKCFVANDVLDFNSDHFPVFLEIPCPITPVIRKKIKTRNMHNVDFEILKNDLISSLQNIDYESDFPLLYQSFSNSCHTAIDNHAPVVSKYVNSNMLPGWMDLDYRKSRSHRRHLEKKWKICNTDESRRAYIEQRKLCTQLAIVKKNIYYKKLIEDSKHDQRALFKIVNNLLDNNKRNRTLPSYSDSHMLANKFNTFFIEKVNRIRSSIPISISSPSTYSRFTAGKLLIFKEVTVNDILAAVKGKIKTSPLDPLPCKFLQAFIHDLAPYYCTLINRSFQSGSVDGIQISVVDPLLKNIKLNSELENSYRPVANLLFFSKLIERLVHTQLNEHMKQYALHDDSQFGYKKYCSTETLLLSMLDEILKGFDENKSTVVIFLDLSAAFDTVDIDKLLEILCIEIGIDNLALKWIESFLRGRRQCVRIDGTISDFLNTTFGFPQGSVLGPFLFSIYVRSQSMVFQRCNFKSSSFADDCNGRKTFSLTFQFHNLSNQIVNCLQEISRWMNEHFLKINTDKTEIVLFCPKENNSDVIIKGVILENKECIRFSDEVKNLGVWLDMNLNFNKQINYIASHCHKLIKDIWKVRPVLSRQDTETLMHSVISSRIDNCNSLYYNISSKNIKQLQKVQNSAVRLVYRVGRRCSITNLRRELHWLPVSSRIIFKIILLTHKCIFNKCSNSLIQLLTYRDFTRSDSDLLLHTPSAKSSYGERTFTYIAPRLWNSLPTAIRAEEDTDTFKKRLKTLLFDGTDDILKKALCFK